jgi:hypothetical protein
MFDLAPTAGQNVGIAIVALSHAGFKRGAKIARFCG